MLKLSDAYLLLTVREKRNILLSLSGSILNEGILRNATVYYKEETYIFSISLRTLFSFYSSYYKLKKYILKL